MTTPFRALYYPSWDPPAHWLRAMLLFFDQIQVILPADVGDPEYSEANRAIFDVAPEVFFEIKKKHYELGLTENNREIVQASLDQIRRPVDIDLARRVSIKITSGGRVSVPGYTFTHTSKLSEWMLEQLKKRALILTEVEPLFHEQFGMAKFRCLDHRASDLVLSLIADDYGKIHGLRTITDENLSYITNALNVDSQQRREAAAMNLASVVLRVQIPREIESLKPEDYLELRRRYEELRGPFQHAMMKLCDDYQLARIRSHKKFEEAVRAAADKFSTDTENLRKSHWGSRITNWSVVGLGILSSFCSLGAGTTLALGTGVSVALHVYQGLRGAEHVTEMRTAQQLLGDLKAEIVHPRLLRKIMIP